MVRFRSFSSGSCGNCYYLALEEEGKVTAGILIDAGVSLRRVKKEFIAMGLGTSAFSDILVTHDHMDHIRGLGSFCKHMDVRIWATGTLLKALSHGTYELDAVNATKMELREGQWTDIVPGKIAARCFEVPHDATQTVGYSIRIGGYEFAIMTDLGAVTEEALRAARDASAVVIESNYDVDMLMGGPYPHELKMRICQGAGHLSNDLCAEAIKKFYHKGLRHIFLCHLSENNNTPHLAYECSRAALDQIGAGDTTLCALPRRTPSQYFNLQS